MKDQTWPKVLLTLNVVLIAIVLWLVVVGPATPKQAAAEPPIQWPNAAEQRLQMINELRDLRQGVDALQDTLERGSITVEVVPN